MITYIKIDGFKSFRNFEMYFSPFTVIAGVNASGKSNLFDALRLLSDLCSSSPIQTILLNQRGDLRELFTLYDNNERSKSMSFTVEMLVDPSVSDEWGQSVNLSITRFRYEVTIEYKDIDTIVISHESLSPVLKKDDKWSSFYLKSKEAKDNWCPSLKNTQRSPFLLLLSESEANGASIVEIHDGGGKKLTHPVNRSMISRFDKTDYPHLFAARKEMLSWRFLHLNPTDLRAPSLKKDSDDTLESSGKNLASTLMRLKREDSYNLIIISQLIRQFLPDYIGIDVREDSEGSKYIVYIKDRQKREYTSHVLSEGTLRIIALCVLAVDNSHSGSICFEEPENGIHTMRLKTMAELMLQLSSDFSNTEFNLRQVIVNTHSPRFVEDVFNLKNKTISVFLTRRVSSIINEGSVKCILQLTRMIPVFSDNEKGYPIPDSLTSQELCLYKRDMTDYLNRKNSEEIQ